jgi:hypothetical protein
VFHKGDYVRMKLSPHTRMGTVEDNKLERRYVQYLFRSDPRFSQRLPDVYLTEDELKHSERPSDTEIAKIDSLIRRAEKTVSIPVGDLRFFGFGGRTIAERSVQAFLVVALFQELADGSVRFAGDREPNASLSIRILLGKKKAPRTDRNPGCFP